MCRYMGVLQTSETCMTYRNMNLEKVQTPMKVQKLNFENNLRWHVLPSPTPRQTSPPGQWKFSLHSTRKSQNTICKNYFARRRTLFPWNICDFLIYRNEHTFDQKLFVARVSVEKAFWTIKICPSPLLVAYGRNEAVKHKMQSV